MTPEQEDNLVRAIRALLIKLKGFYGTGSGVSNSDLAGAKLRLWVGPAMDVEIKAVQKALSEMQ